MNSRIVWSGMLTFFFTEVAFSLSELPSAYSDQVF